LPKLANTFYSYAQLSDIGSINFGPPGISLQVIPSFAFTGRYTV